MSYGSDTPTARVADDPVAHLRHGNLACLDQTKLLATIGQRKLFGRARPIGKAQREDRGAGRACGNSLESTGGRDGIIHVRLDRNSGRLRDSSSHDVVDGHYVVARAAPIWFVSCVYLKILLSIEEREIAMATLEYWIQLENRPWDLCAHNIDRMTGQNIATAEPGPPATTPISVTLTSTSTGFVRTGVTMFKPIRKGTKLVDALIYRRFACEPTGSDCVCGVTGFSCASGSDRGKSGRREHPASYLW
jgi:hypothetical protein